MSDKKKNEGKKAEETKEEKVDDKKNNECEKRIEELENQVKRTLADYQNLEKRTAEDRKGWIALANRELLLRILPILDTLIMAQKHSSDQTLKVTITQFEEVLKNEGVIKVKTIGEEFDAELMDAIDVTPGEDGKVIEEVQTGYLLNDKLLRPAMVKVGKKVEN